MSFKSPIKLLFVLLTGQLREPTMGHNVLLLVLTSVMVCFFIVTIVFNILSMNSENGKSFVSVV